jgi:hypothetical protein
MAVIGFICGLIALAVAGDARRQSTLLRRELDALRGELRIPSSGDAAPAPET